jgi:hypothetical protein
MNPPCTSPVSLLAIAARPRGATHREEGGVVSFPIAFAYPFVDTIRAFFLSHWYISI